MGLSHFVAWQRETFSIQPADRVAQLTNLSFDVALRDIFTPLCSGATICLPPDTLDPVNPWPWFQGARITRLHAVPSLASIWLDRAPDGACYSLKTVFFAGEPLTDSLVHRWRRVAPGAEIINLYGPTETTLAKCWHRVSDPPDHGVQPIGTSLPGSQALVIGDEGRLCGAGETGEIVIRTPYRTKGYLKSSGRSGFATNPFREEADDIIYYTGDLGRYRADGVLEILGRKDDQLKILGVRVEPGEIVAALTRHPEIRHGFVMPHPAAATSLVAYVVADKTRVDARQLSAHLSSLLQPALIPRWFVFLDHLPLNTNGKIDRGALPLPSVTAAPLSESDAAPQTDTERKVANIWREILGLEKISRNDSFFSLGGHSLLVTKLAARIRDVFGVQLALRAIFEHPTVHELAWYLDADAQAAHAPIMSGDHADLTLDQKKLWSLHQAARDAHYYNIARAVSINGELDMPALRAAVNRIVQRQRSCTPFTKTVSTGGARAPWPLTTCR